MEVIRKGDFIFVVERVKNDVNGNPRYEILPLLLADNEHVLNLSCELRYEGYKVKKGYTRIILQSYDIQSSIEEMYKIAVNRLKIK